MIVVQVSHVPGSVWPAAVVVCGGLDDGGLGDRDVNEGLDGVVLGGRLCGGRGRWWEGGVGCGWWGVLVLVRVWVRVVSLGLASLPLWCCVRSFGRRLGFWGQVGGWGPVPG